METFELRYFFAVAGHESVHRAARELAVSPGALSKAVARLEDELGVPLFERVGRNIRLTSYGRLLQKRAGELLRLEESTRVEIRGHAAEFHVRIGGPEVVLTEVAPDLARRVLARHPRARFELTVHSEPETIRKVAQGELHIGLLTGDAPAGLTARPLFSTTFKTCVGRGHPLYRAAKAGTAVPVRRVLEHGFVLPEHALLGQTGSGPSPDGWRDDKLERRVAVRTSSLQLLSELVTTGQAVAYLPDYFAAKIDAAALRLTGCPYKCEQTLSMIADRPQDTGWLHQLF
jgi:DNA-binding transcriptional LysR family regulator